ncbi:MAG: hypothetical protein SPI14_06005 [Arcanobacterium sp.]|nr:hypothetical protein [Arcanobacterium sp.]
MCDAIWLYWVIHALMEWLAGVIRRIIHAAYAAQREHEKKVDVRAVAKQLFPYVRAAGRVAWFAQIAHVKHEGMIHAMLPAYIPSAPPIAPSTVEAIVREELRVNAHGRITAPLEDVTRRVSNRLTSLIPQSARSTMAHMSDDSTRRISGSVDYSRDHGHPLVRFTLSLNDNSTDLGRLMESDRDFEALVDVIVEDAYDDARQVDVDALDVSMMRDGNMYRNDPDLDMMDVMGRAFRDAVKADIYLWDEHTYLSQIQRNAQQKNRGSRSRGMRRIQENTPVIKWADWWDKHHPDDKPEGYESFEDKRVKALKAVDEFEQQNGAGWFAAQQLRWARIPVGEYTCGFCLTLASRGAVYHSKHSASGGDKSGAYGTAAYHDNCDCIIVPVWNADDYPFKHVTDAAKRLYDAQGRDLFTMNRDQLATLTRSFPKINNAAYTMMVKSQQRRIQALKRAA